MISLLTIQRSSILMMMNRFLVKDNFSEEILTQLVQKQEVLVDYMESPSGNVLQIRPSAYNYSDTRQLKTCNSKVMTELPAKLLKLTGKILHRTQLRKSLANNFAPQSKLL